jgi:hypothetical protein
MGGGRGSAVEIGGQKGEPGGHAANSSNRFHIFEGDGLDHGCGSVVWKILLVFSLTAIDFSKNYQGGS